MRFLVSVMLVVALTGCAGSTSSSSSSAATTRSGSKSSAGVSADVGSSGKAQSDSYMHLADKAKAEGRADLAAVLYRAAALANETDATPRIASADLFEKVGENRAAADLYSQLAKETQDYDLFILAARNYLKVGETEKSREHYQTAIAQKPRDWRAHNGMAVLEDFERKHKVAQLDYAKAREYAADEKDIVSILANWSLSLILGGDAGEAISLLEKHPGAAENDVLRTRLALAYGLAGRTDDARRLGLTKVPTYDDLDRELRSGGLLPSVTADKPGGPGDILYTPVKPQ